MIYLAQAVFLSIIFTLNTHIAILKIENLLQTD